jgi:hypothetical protein
MGACGQAPLPRGAYASNTRRLRQLQAALLPPRQQLRSPSGGEGSGVAAQPTMHSSGLRSENFSIVDRGRPLSLAAFLPHIGRTSRVGIVAPGQGTEGAGAATLILAMVTMFYNDLRAHDPLGAKTLANKGDDDDERRRRGGDFFAYPDFFVFQPPARGHDSPASYSMFDVWPSHKWVVVEGDGRPIDWLRAITDRAVDVLLVADDVTPAADRRRRRRLSSRDGSSDNFSRLALHSAGRVIRQCWAYSSQGHARRADVVVRYDPRGALLPNSSSPSSPDSGDGCGGGPDDAAAGAALDPDLDLASWMRTVFEAEREVPLPLPGSGSGCRGGLEAAIGAAAPRGGVIEQSYRRLPLEEALAML